tara:strand:+ start:269 stop:601 length:333 start_codon:yes stop_codon:yes gene_type:complete
MDMDKVVSLLKMFRLCGTGADPAQPTNWMARKLTNGEHLVSVLGVWWWLNDNGGEVNLRRVNVDRLPTSVAAEGMNEATVAYRLAFVMRGEPVDYGFRMSDADQQTMLEG